MRTKRRRLWTFLAVAFVFVPQGWVVLSCPFYKRALGLFLPFIGEPCYGYYRFKATWRDAVDFCKKEGFTLARLTGQEENNKMMYRIGFRKMKTECVWIGLSDPESNGQWRWLDGSLMNTDLFSSKDPEHLASCAMICADFTGHSYEIERRDCSTSLDITLCEAYTSEAPPNKYTTMSDGTSMREESSTTDVTTLNMRTTPIYTTTHQQPTESTQAPVVKYSTIVKVSSGTFIKGKPEFRVHAFTATMCARLSSKSVPFCPIFNFNRVTKECVGFLSVDTLMMEKREQWDVWMQQGRKKIDIHLIRVIPKLIQETKSKVFSSANKKATSEAMTMKCA